MSGYCSFAVSPCVRFFRSFPGLLRSMRHLPGLSFDLCMRLRLGMCNGFGSGICLLLRSSLCLDPFSFRPVTCLPFPAAFVLKA